LPELPERVKVAINPRLSVSLARSLLSTNVIELSPRLLKRGRRLRLEVLCHEAAHLAVSGGTGHAARPHGPEWAEFMRMAGFEPRATIANRCQLAGAAIKPRPRDRSRVYEHRCPVCQFTRRARRPVPVWLCKSCVDAGLPGKLLICRRAVGDTR
jgi:predicted SprT family Zn-dependent metalloprotease